MLYQFRHKILGPVAIVWLLLTVASGVEQAIIWSRPSRNFQQSAEGAQLGESLERLFSALQDAETGARGFLLTGDEAYLEPYTSAESSLSIDFNRIAEIAAKDRVLQSDLLKLRGLASLKMAELKDSIKVRRENGLTGAVAQVNTGKDKNLMDQIRKVVAQMSQERLNIFSSAGEATRCHLERGQTMSAIAGFMAIGTGLFAIYLVWTGYLQEQAKHELLGQKLRAEKSAGEKSAFLANMSHEIRTPMNAILGFGELLEGEQLTPKQAQYVRSIRQSGASLLQLINDVLDLSKLEAGRMELYLEPTDMKEFCGFLQTMFAQQAAAKSLALKFEIGDVPRAMLLDQLRLRQVLVNLIGNALKFTTKGFVRTRIDWEHESDDKSRGTLLIEVEDTGIGISPEKREEIFKPFVQSEPRRTGENEGTGLGLDIVQRMMELMKGTVTLESTPGKGSAFRLRIAEVSVSARLPVSNLVQAEETVNFDDFSPAILLVVDDNETNRKLIKSMFENTHHRVRIARNGQEALKSIEQVKPAMVLLDVRMPVMGGLQTLAEIRKFPDLELLPVIAVTASSWADEECDLSDHFNGYLRKPFSQRELYKTLEEFLTRKEAEKGPTEGSSGGTPPPPAIATAKRAADWEILVAELRTLHAGEWDALRESLAINHTHAFARKLHFLAEQTKCTPLAAYAETLEAHAEAYAVHDLEIHLAAFPDMVKMIEDQTKVPCG
jgi:signal transduction histidine kinase/CheY-like chemotaxis protein